MRLLVERALTCSFDDPQEYDVYRLGNRFPLTYSQCHVYIGIRISDK